jgi:GNAT superfamily N-acetyltransferase
MSEIVIRAAVADDWRTIAEFNCRLSEETESTTLDPTAIEPGVQRLLADPRKGRYFVACSDEQIIGQLMHTYEWSDWRNGEIWWLQSVYVHPDFRRQGVFRSLYEHLQNEAESDPDVVGLRLYVERDNEHAHETYEKFGMKRPGYFVMQWLLSR